MNERIKELAAQAGMHFDKYDLAFADNNHAEDGVDLEKFAELIIRECARVCLSQRDLTNLNYKPSERFAEAVKVHFGVEE